MEQGFYFSRNLEKLKINTYNTKTENFKITVHSGFISAHFLSLELNTKWFHSICIYLSDQNHLKIDYQRWDYILFKVSPVHRLCDKLWDFMKLKLQVRKIVQKLTENGIKEFFTDGMIHCWNNEAKTCKPIKTSSNRFTKNLLIKGKKRKKQINH